jgi:hypothetical protein
LPQALPQPLSQQVLQALWQQDFLQRKMPANRPPHLRFLQQPLPQVLQGSQQAAASQHAGSQACSQQAGSQQAGSQQLDLQQRLQSNRPFNPLNRPQ